MNTLTKALSYYFGCEINQKAEKPLFITLQIKENATDRTYLIASNIFGEILKYFSCSQACQFKYVCRDWNQVILKEHPILKIDKNRFFPEAFKIPQLISYFEPKQKCHSTRELLRYSSKEQALKFLNFICDEETSESQAIFTTLFHSTDFLIFMIKLWSKAKVKSEKLKALYRLIRNQDWPAFIRACEIFQIEDYRHPLFQTLINQGPSILHHLYKKMPQSREDKEFFFTTLKNLPKNLITPLSDFDIGLKTELEHDPDFFKKALQHNGLVLEFAPQKEKNNPITVWEAINQNGLAIAFANQQFKGNLKFGLAAVTNNGLALRHLSKKLKDNPEILSAAMAQNIGAYTYASKRLQRNIALACEVVRQYPTKFQHFLPEIRNSKRVYLELMKTDPDIGIIFSDYTSESIKHDEEIQLLAIEKYGTQYWYLPDKLKYNKKLFCAALRDSPKVFSMAPLSMQISCYHKKIFYTLERQFQQASYFLQYSLSG